MAFMKKDINFGLLFIIIVLAIAVAIIGVYYNSNYTNLSNQYNTQLSNLRKVTDDLMAHKSQLNKTVADLQTKEQDETDLSNKYATLRGENEQLTTERTNLQQELVSKNNEIVQKTNDLISARGQVAQQQIEIDELNRQNKLLQTSLSNQRDKTTLICQGQTNLCS